LEPVADGAISFIMIRNAPQARRRVAGVVAAALLLTPVALPPGPAAAQDSAEPAPVPEDRADALGEAARRALEDLLADLRPVFDALRATIEDLPRYGPPEVLPNGDILIPRLDTPGAEDSPETAPEDPDAPDRLDL
jgi:hypothetical protein